MRLFYLVMVVLGWSVSAQATDVTTSPFAGVTHIHRTLTSPRPQNIHIVRIDLTAPNIGVVVTPSNGSGGGDADAVSTTAFLSLTGAQIAINAGFYNMITNDVLGYVSDAGDNYSCFVDYNQWENWPTPFVALDLSYDNTPSMVFPGAPMPTCVTAPVARTWNTVPGGEWIVRSGVRVVNNSFSVNPGRHPRTCGGYTQDGKELILVTIDGRQPGFSDGMTTVEAADLLIGLGVHQGINFDGGGSTTLAFADPSPRVVNAPSNTGGVQRRVPNHLGVYTSYTPEKPVAVKHISFENNFGTAAYIDNQDGVGAIQFVADGPSGTAAAFTNPTVAGQGDHLQFAYTPGDEGTIAMFLNIDQNYNYQNVWDCGLNGWTWEMYNDANVGRFYSKINGWPGCYLTIGGDFKLNQWFHYTWTWKRTGSTVAHKLYVNGTQVPGAGGSASQTWTEPGEVFNVGGGVAGNFKYNGKMDEFYIFDRAMNDFQVEALYTKTNSGKLAFDPHPFVGRVRMAQARQLRWQAPRSVNTPLYAVYFGTNPILSESDNIADGIAAMQIPIDCVAGQTYYWRVDVMDDGQVHRGLVWSFVADYSPADLNTDGWVDYEDFVMLARHWADEVSPCIADINGDGVVDINDLEMMAVEWLD